MRKLYLSLLLIISLLALGCAGTLRLREEADSSSGQDQGLGGSVKFPAKSGNFVHSVQADGSVVSTVVDATDYDAWQKLDLDTGYAETDGWDLALRRFVVLSNGGVSGSGGVQLLKLTGVTFDSVTEAPGAEAEWSVDQKDGDDEDTAADNPFNGETNGWYEYEVGSHTLTARDAVYLIRSTEGRYYKLRIEDYYDEVGTPAMLSFRWAEIEGPEEDLPPQEVPVDPTDPTDPVEIPIDESLVITVDATSYDDWVYLKLGKGVVSVTASTSSTAWDLAIRRVSFLTNSGTSGPGIGGAKLDESGVGFEELETTDTANFVEDEILPASGAPGSVEDTGNPILEDWYDYLGLGSLTPKSITFIIRTANGSYGKLRIFSYSGGTYQLSFLPVTASP